MIRPALFLFVIALPIGSSLAQTPPLGPVLPRFEASSIPTRAPGPSGNLGRQFGDPMECLVEPSLVTSLGSPVEGTLFEVLVAMLLGFQHVGQLQLRVRPCQA